MSYPSHKHLCYNSRQWLWCVVIFCCTTLFAFSSAFTLYTPAINTQSTIFPFEILFATPNDTLSSTAFDIASGTLVLNFSSLPFEIPQQYDIPVSTACYNITSHELLDDTTILFEFFQWDEHTNIFTIPLEFPYNYNSTTSKTSLPEAYCTFYGTIPLPSNINMTIPTTTTYPLVATFTTKSSKAVFTTTQQIAFDYPFAQNVDLVYKTYNRTTQYIETISVTNLTASTVTSTDLIPLSDLWIQLTTSQIDSSNLFLGQVNTTTTSATTTTCTINNKNFTYELIPTENPRMIHILDVFSTNVAQLSTHIIPTVQSNLTITCYNIVVHDLEPDEDNNWFQQVLYVVIQGSQSLPQNSIATLSDITSTSAYRQYNAFAIQPPFLPYSSKISPLKWAFVAWLILFTAVGIVLMARYIRHDYKTNKFLQSQENNENVGQIDIPLTESDQLPSPSQQDDNLFDHHSNNGKDDKQQTQQQQPQQTQPQPQPQQEDDHPYNELDDSLAEVTANASKKLKEKQAKKQAKQQAKLEAKKKKYTTLLQDDGDNDDNDDIGYEELPVDAIQHDVETTPNKTFGKYKGRGDDQGGYSAMK